MSRELKFRAWDKKNRAYAKVLKIYFGSNSSLLGVLVEDYDTNHAYELGPEQIRLEQCTGLKDKNGNEIYEGDIVKTESPDMPNFGAGAIAMQQQMYVIMNAPIYDDPEFSHCELLGYYCDTELEIIGNIHENPELLK